MKKKELEQRIEANSRDIRALRGNSREERGQISADLHKHTQYTIKNIVELKKRVAELETAEAILKVMQDHRQGKPDFSLQDLLELRKLRDTPKPLDIDALIAEQTKTPEDKAEWNEVVMESEPHIYGASHMDISDTPGAVALGRTCHPKHKFGCDLYAVPYYSEDRVMYAYRARWGNGMGEQTTTDETANQIAKGRHMDLIGWED